MREAVDPARIAQLHDWLEAGLRDAHEDWIKAYGMVSAKVLEQRGADAREVQGLREHPLLADQLLTAADIAARAQMVNEIFAAISSAEAYGGPYAASQVPAAMLAALAHHYPKPDPRQPSP